MHHVSQNVHDSRNLRGVLAREPSRAPRDVSKVTEVWICAIQFNVKSPLTSQLQAQHHTSSQDVRIVCPRPKMMVRRTYRKPRSAKLTKWSTTYKHADLSARMQTNLRHGAVYLDQWIPLSLHNGQIRISKIDKDNVFGGLRVACCL